MTSSEASTETVDERTPTVSIGLAVRNGGALLRRALDSLLGQTFSDFQLLVSDNASADETPATCREYAERDARVRWYRQPSNLGPVGNFDFVLREARGRFFMWAAHDDCWHPRFLETAVRVFQGSDRSTVAVAAEACYTIDAVEQPFFPEGAAFYGFASDNAVERVRWMLRNNYGNLFYSLFRRDALMTGQRTVLSALQTATLNEIPLFIQVAAKGNWRVVPDVLFFKDTTRGTYERARWETTGGPHPPCSVSDYLGGLFYGLRYHLSAFDGIAKSIRRLEFPRRQRLLLGAVATATLGRHYAQLMLRHKPPAL